MSSSQSSGQCIVTLRKAPGLNPRVLNEYGFLLTTWGGKTDGVLLEYPTTTGFQWGTCKEWPIHLHSGGNGRVF